jgi:hypothetical protein
VTLVVTVNGPETIWLLADRRLSFKDRLPRDDARKVMFLETTDGLAILGYAGLGATGRGTEPSDWMSAVLRGRNLPLEQSLAVLAEAMKKQFPPHMVRMPGDSGPAHSVIVPAFLGTEPRVYTIDLAFAPDRKSYAFRCTRHVHSLAMPRTPRMAIYGSGAPYLAQDKSWTRSLLRVVRANDRGHVSSLAVADHMASLNYKVHRGVSDNSVGPRCIVAWRRRKGGVHKGGGAQQFYTGTTRDASSSSLPIIGNGMDIQAISNLMMPRMLKRFEAMRGGQPATDLNEAEINAELARLPDKPRRKPSIARFLDRLTGGLRLGPVRVHGRYCPRQSCQQRAHRYPRWSLRSPTWRIWPPKPNWPTSGYRLYFVRRGTDDVILNCGGDKHTQERDISRAKLLAAKL